MSRPATDDINDPFCDAYWELGPGKDRDPQRKYSANGSREASDGATELRDLQDNEISRLAKLRSVEYERERMAAAKRLGMRVSMLDKLVAAEKPPSATPGQGKALAFDEPEPWPSPIDGAALLDEIEKLIRDFVVCGKHSAVAMALWVALTWFEEVAQVAPILSFRSPVMRCGKSTCLAVIGRLVKRRLLTSNTTTAALFRAIEKFQPTLVVDEADAFFAQNEELRGIINSGHTRDAAHILRTVGEDLEPRTFSTWSFKAVAGIGNLASTIEDRSITIDLQRKTRDETVSRLRHANPQKFETLSSKLARFSSDNMARFAQARPALPDTLNDRQQDNWDHLLALAGLAGPVWAGKAREAALALCGAAENADTQRESLLADIIEVLNESNFIDENGNLIENNVTVHTGAGRPKEVVGIASSLLVNKLIAMADRPWCEINRGKALTQNGLARKLKPFGIRPRTIGDMKGYPVPDLVAAFTRYCAHFLKNGSQSVGNKFVNDFNDLTENKTVGNSPGISQPSQIIHKQHQIDNPNSDGSTDGRDHPGANTKRIVI